MTISETSAGGVVYRHAAQGVLLLLGEQRDVNTGQQTVRLPKGRREPGETLEETALREVLEETAETAEIREPLGEVSYVYFDRARGEEVAKRVVFFLMEARSPKAPEASGGEPARVPDGELERILWCPPAEALEKLSFETERIVVRRAQKRLFDL
jgi:diadenosine hexaphosphate hydrolase (ATP-forming)